MKKILFFIFLFSLSLAQQQTSSSSRRPPVRPPPSSMRPPSVSKNATALRDLDYEVVKLSYIQTDRALAILKTMVDTVVEFRPGKGEISVENNFTPVYSNKIDNINAKTAKAPQAFDDKLQNFKYFSFIKKTPI